MTLYIYSNETAKVVEKVTGGTQQEQMDYADSNYDSADYGWTYSPAWGMADGLIDTGDAKETHLAEWPERGAAWNQFCAALTVQEVR